MSLLRDVYPAIYQHIYREYNVGLDPDLLTIDYPNEIIWTTKCIFCNQYQSMKYTLDNYLNSVNFCFICNYRVKPSRPCKIKDSFMIRSITLMMQFDQSLNPGINPFLISWSSHVVINWKCFIHKTCNEHIWPARPNDRSSYNTKCPFCTPYTNRFCSCNTVNITHPHLVNDLTLP